MECELTHAPPFVIDLARWVNDTNIAKDIVNIHSKAFRSQKVKDHIPKCYATLMKTPLHKIVLKRDPGYVFSLWDSIAFFFSF